MRARRSPAARFYAHTQVQLPALSRTTTINELWRMYCAHMEQEAEDCVGAYRSPCCRVATAHEQRRTRAGRNTFIHLAKKITTHPPDLRAGANYVKEECGRQAAHGGGTRARLADCASGALVSFCAHTRPGGRLTVTPVSERTGRQWCDRRCEPWRPRMLSQTSRQLSGASKGRFTVGWCQTAGGTASTATAAGAATMALGKRLSGNSARETRPSRLREQARARFWRAGPQLYSHRTLLSLRVSVLRGRQCRHRPCRMTAALSCVRVTPSVCQTPLTRAAGGAR